MAHTHYKGTGKIHSFRGLLADGEQDKISIQGPTGDRAWRIVKFQLFAPTPGTTEYENVVQVFRESQSTAVATVDFSDADLIAAAYLEGHSNPSVIDAVIVVFDNILFSRNIYVTHKNADSGAEACNYYIELEEVKVSAAGMAQLSLAASRRVQSDV